MTWRGQAVLVTGACGFIGSHLVEALVRRGANVRGLALYNPRGTYGWMEELAPEIKSSVEMVLGDVRDGDAMRRFMEPEAYVFHLAALIGIPYSYQSPRSYVDTNLVGTLNMLEAARDLGVKRLLITSTSEVYGTALTVPIDENHPLQGQSPYSASKIGADKLAESYHLSFGVPVTTMRPFNTFGPRQSARAVIPTIVMQLLNGGEQLRLGDPTTTRDFTFVEDTAEGMIRLAESDMTIGRAVNIGTGRDISIAETAALAMKVTGRQAEIVADVQRLRPENSEVRRLQADASLMKALTGWVPPWRVEEGIEKVAEWMKPRLALYESDRYYT
jgi:NAD dependent epimerase/dehydratase